METGREEAGGKSSPELVSIYQDMANNGPGAQDTVDDTLYFACERHQLDYDLINGILAEKPLALSTPRDRGWLPIHHAAMANSYDAVELLLQRFPGGVAVEQDDGFLPLHMAVYFEDVDYDVVAMILRANTAAAEHKSKDGRTALHIALENINIELRLVKLLLEAYPGAAHVATDMGLLPLHICVENKNCSLDIFTTVLEAFPGAACVRDAPPRYKTPMHYAVMTAGAGREVFVSIVKLLVDTSAETLLIGDSSGKTPLHLVLTLLASCASNRTLQSPPMGEPHTPRSRLGSSEGEEVAAINGGGDLTPLGETDHSTETHSIGSKFCEFSGDGALWAILDMFLSALPEGTREKCYAGRLPLVEYLENAAHPSAEVVEAVAKASPQTLMVTDRCGRTPLHILLSK